MSDTRIPITEPVDPAARVVDFLGREWATTTNGTWAALGHAVTVDAYPDLVGRFGVAEVRA